MALSKNQEDLIKKGFSFSVRRNSITMLEILKSNCTESNLVKVADAVKTAIIATKTAKKTALATEIADLKK